MKTTKNATKLQGNNVASEVKEVIENNLKIVINQRNFSFITEIETKKEINFFKVSKSLSIYLETKMNNSIKLKNLGLKKCKGSFLFSRSFELSIYNNEKIILDSVKFNNIQDEKYKITCKDKETFEAVLNIMFTSKNFATIFDENN
jgi:hypothetical protein